jgi:monoamine oxidase
MPSTGPSEGDLAAAVDVAVVGAGFSGLMVATHLAQRGYRVVVLEATSRVGGRTLTIDVAGTWLEPGGQWTGPEQPRLAALASDFGVATFATPSDGVDLIVIDGEVSAVDAARADAGFVTAIAQLDSLCADVLPDEPWRSPRAAEWDELSVDSWLAREVASPGARRQLQVLLSELMTTPVDEFSMLTLLHGARTSGSLSAAIGIEDGAQAYRIVGGVHQLAVGVQQRLGDRVQMDCAVRGVTWTESVATVVTSRGSVDARRVVFAVPPSQLRQVTFDPPLPPRRQRLAQLMPLGSVIKVNVVYERPFWRDAGLSGAVFDTEGPAGYAIDNSSPDSEYGVLVSFFAAEHARALADRRLGGNAAQVRRDAWLTRAVEWFGPQAAAPLHYVDLDWCSQPYVEGGYSGVMRPGGWSECGVSLRDPIGPIHWAGSETATEWTGYIEGALQAGARAAEEIAETFAS